MGMARAILHGKLKSGGICADQFSARRNITFAQSVCFVKIFHLRIRGTLPKLAQYLASRGDR